MGRTLRGGSAGSVEFEALNRVESVAVVAAELDRGMRPSRVSRYASDFGSSRRCANSSAVSSRPPRAFLPVHSTALTSVRGRTSPTVPTFVPTRPCSPRLRPRPDPPSAPSPPPCISAPAIRDSYAARSSTSPFLSSIRPWLPHFVSCFDGPNAFLTSASVPSTRPPPPEFRASAYLRMQHVLCRVLQPNRRFLSVRAADA